ncbi:MAG: lamin tail domain-containing protein, partial [Candidatus Bipolaricaulia bacterium]
MRQMNRRVKVGIGILGLSLLFWVGFSPSAFTQVVINEVLFLPDSGEQLIEIANLGDAEAELTGWFLCNRPSYWRFPSGTTIAPGEVLVVHVGVRGENTETDLFASGLSRLNATADETALYSSGNFGSANALVDFVQWGAARQSPTRLNVAISAGQWNSGEFVDISALEVGQSIAYQGTGTV